MEVSGAVPAGRDELVERFASFPDRLASAAWAAEGRPVPEDEWSPAQVVRHLIAVESVVWQARLRDLATLQEPHWTRTEPGLGDGFDGASLEELLDEFSMSRAASVAVVRALDDSGWTRVGVHSTYGRLDVAGLLGVAIDHDDEHARGIRATSA
jgi:hypothetical protein